MTILDALIQLRDDIKAWATVNFNNKSDVSHTHNYAGSSSPGGVASKATSATSATYATTATKAGTATYATNASTSSYSSNGAKATSATSATYASTASKAGTATYASNASSATHADISDAAVSDNAGLNINDTYIKSASVSGKVVTFTKGNGSTFSITTQDNNTTYSNYKGATTAASGTAGLVPAATTATRTNFLRGDGTWATPSYATSAGSASTATNAGTATYATNSGTATYASNSNSAVYATNSGTASYSSNSAKATSATSATYATTATSAGSASKATSATSATYATTATSAGSASKATSATSATYASTANYAKNSRTYVGATTAAAGTSGFVPAATTATRTYFLRGDGTWAIPSKASTADYATNAGTASYSSNGAKATSATSATYASTASKAGTATYATNSGTASYSSNGAKATSATSATYASTSSKAGTATYATNAGTSSYSSNGAKATSATSATYAATATKAGTATTLNGLTSSVTELNYVDGVTSAIQTQINTINTSLTNKIDGSRVTKIDYDETSLLYVTIDSSNYAVPFGYSKTDISNISSTANAAYTSLANYLPLSGSTMSGNLISTNVRPSASSTYYCGHSTYPWSSVYSNNYYMYGSDGKCYARMYVSTTGTTSTVGHGRLYLGNSTAEGTDGNAQGALLLYGKSTGYTALLPTNHTSTNINLSLPKTSGTIPVATLSGTTLYLYT